MPSDTEFEYGDKYNDATYEYRIVIAPDGFTSKHIKNIASGTLFTEAEWKAVGIQMSRGWEHALWFPAYQNTLLFRRPHGTHPTTGIVDETAKAKALEEFNKKYNEETAPSTGH